ncbi:hypothetical protein CR513_42032, partial [Mucuna pruriens]
CPLCVHRGGNRHCYFPTVVSKHIDIRYHWIREKTYKDTCYKLYGKKKVLKRIGGNKGPTHMWLNILLPHNDSDIQAFSKDEMDHF